MLNVACFRGFRCRMTGCDDEEDEDVVEKDDYES